MSKKNKRIRIAQKVSRKELPFIRENREEHIRFRFDYCDIEDDCEWSLASISNEDHKQLLSKIKEIERLTVSEILSPSFSGFKVYSNFQECPNPKSLRRFEQICRGDFDDFCRFRLSGTQRLYGFLSNNEFHIVWWDPAHEVWPSQKKHT